MFLSQEAIFPKSQKFRLTSIILFITKPNRGTPHPANVLILIQRAILHIANIFCNCCCLSERRTKDLTKDLGVPEEQRIPWKISFQCLPFF